MVSPPTRRLALVTPLPRDWYPAVWAWARETPDANFDDSGPQTPEAFGALLEARQMAGQVFGILIDGVPSGVVGYQRLDARVGLLRGICFRRAVHGSGLPRAAVALVLEILMMQGVVKIQAQFFETNRRVARFLGHLGFRTEGVLRAQTTQQGRPIDVRLMARFAEGV